MKTLKQCWQEAQAHLGISHITQEGQRKLQAVFNCGFLAALSIARRNKLRSKDFASYQAELEEFLVLAKHMREQEEARYGEPNEPA